MFSNFFEWFVTKPTSNVENKVPENSSKSLKFQLKQSLLDQAGVSEKNTKADSGEQAYKDFHRMNLIVNDKVIHKNFANQLYDKYSGLILGYDEDKNYRPFAERILDEMFYYAQATDPGYVLKEELIRSCNQAGHEYVIYDQMHHILAQYNLLQGNPDGRTVHIDCLDSDYVKIKYNSSVPIYNFDNIEQKICELDTSLEFAIKLHDGKAQYEKGKVTFILPKEFENYHANGASLLDDISKHFGGVQPISKNADEDYESFFIVPENPNDGKNTTTDDDLSSFMTFQNLGDAGFPSFIEIAKRRTVAVS